jgi:predicted AlkP superfamily phosphohydrolase/phosphomutase
VFGLKKKKSGKAVVLGLDGVPHSLLKEYITRGIMPELGKLAQTGSLLKMKSTLPEISSVAWTSFMTGKNPGEHGIFGFMEINRDTYEYTFPDFYSPKERPIWERNGYKSVVLNIPQTYPAKPLNGVLVSGFVALDLKKAAYPERVFQYLSGMGYRIDVNSRLAAENPDEFFKDLFLTLSKRKEAIEHLYKNEDWDLFISAITETDRLHHFFFDSALAGPYYEKFERFYHEIDAFIGKMAALAKEDGAAFLTCSDHGFTAIKSEVYINRWLIENGYLTLNPGDGLTGITQDSRAFNLDPSRIYIHLKGKYGRGAVESAEYEPLRQELKEKIKEITFEGQKVIKQVFTKEEIFRGPQAPNGPDLYLLPNYSFDLKGVASRQTVFGMSRFRGMHTYDDAHLFCSEAIALPDPKIEDVASMIAGFIG